MSFPQATLMLNRLLSLLGLGSGGSPSGSPFVPVYDDLQFDTTGFTLEEDSPEHRAWRAPNGCVVFLTIGRAEPPGLSSPGALESWREFCAAANLKQGAGLVEVESLSAGGQPARLIIVKTIRDTGLRYVAALQILFRDFIFNLSVYADDGGHDQVRTAVLTDRFLKENRVRPSAAAPRMGSVAIMHLPEHKEGWVVEWLATRDIPPNLARNIAEDRAYDAEFPLHPLSRARSVIAHLRGSIKLTSRVKQAGRYV